MPTSLTEVRLENGAQGGRISEEPVQHLAGPFKPSEFRDSYRENIERLIEQKQQGEPVSATAQTKRAPVIDLMEALKRSLAAPPDRGRMARNRAGKKSKKARAA